MHRTLTLIALLSLASPVIAGDESEVMEGSWRFEGESFRGPYQGLMHVFRLPQGRDLIYERTFDGGANVQERGRVLVGGGTVFTQQIVSPGLLDQLQLDRSTIAQRHGVYRLDTDVDNAWRPITGAPSDVLGRPGSGQGWYDIAIAVDPTDANTIYMGGATRRTPVVHGPTTVIEWPAALDRGVVTKTVSGGTTKIGRAHV